MRSKDWILTHCTKDWRWNEAEEGAEKKWPIGLEKSTRGEGNISELNHRYTLHQCHIFIFVLFLCKLKALVENGRRVHRITLYYVCNFLWICYYFKIFFKSFKSLVKKSILRKRKWITVQCCWELTKDENLWGAAAVTQQGPKHGSSAFKRGCEKIKDCTCSHFSEVCCWKGVLKNKARVGCGVWSSMCFSLYFELCP